MNASTSPDVDRCDGREEGWLLRLVADGLAANGTEVWPTGGAGEHLVIGFGEGRCELSVEDCGRVHWDFRPVPGEPADPRRMADLATALLTGHAWAPPDDEAASARPGGSTLKGRVGRELRARGMTVRLNVFADQEFLDACVDVTAVAPDDQRGADTPGGEICVTDDGILTWTRDFLDDRESITWEPDHSSTITDPEGLAADIVAAVTQALHECLPD